MDFVSIFLTTWIQSDILFQEYFRQSPEDFSALLMIFKKSFAESCQLCYLFDLQKIVIRISTCAHHTTFQTNDDNSRRSPANWTCPSVPNGDSPRTSLQLDESRRLKRENLFANGCPANEIKKVALLGCFISKSK